MRITAVLFACGLALGTYTLNASSNAGLPAGWSVGGEAPKLYDADMDRADSPSGKGSKVLRRIEASHPYGSAHLAQSFPVAPYAGKRVRLSMRVRFQDVGKYDGKIYIGAGSSAHEQAQEFSGDWDLFQTTLTLAADTTQLDIGVGLHGPGSAKVDAIELQVLGDAPPGQHGTSMSAAEVRLKVAR